MCGLTARDKLKLRTCQSTRPYFRYSESILQRSNCTKLPHQHNLTSLDALLKHRKSSQTLCDVCRGCKEKDIPSLMPLGLSQYSPLRTPQRNRVHRVPSQRTSAERQHLSVCLNKTCKKQGSPQVALSHPGSSPDTAIFLLGCNFVCWPVHWLSYFVCLMLIILLASMYTCPYLHAAPLQTWILETSSRLSGSGSLAMYTFLQTLSWYVHMVLQIAKFVEDLGLTELEVERTGCLGEALPFPCLAVPFASLHRNEPFVINTFFGSKANAQLCFIKRSLLSIKGPWYYVMPCKRYLTCSESCHVCISKSCSASTSCFLVHSLSKTRLNLASCWSQKFVLSPVFDSSSLCLRI